MRPERRRLGSWPSALLAGCAGLAGHFQGSRSSASTASSCAAWGSRVATLDLIVSVYNPNDFDLHGTRLQVGFDVEESHLGDIDYDRRFRSCQKGDTTTLTLPLRFNWAGLGGAARDGARLRRAAVHDEGPADGRDPLRRPHRSPFTHEGRAPLSRVGGVRRSRRPMTPRAEEPASGH